MDIDIQNYKNGLCCPAPPQGLITLTGGVADGLYTDLASAISWLQTFTSATITDASLSGDTFKFTVPTGSDFSLVDDFMAGVRASFIDNDGLVVLLGNNAFNSNRGNNVLGNCTFGDISFSDTAGDNTLGNCTFGDDCFAAASGNNTIGNILLSNTSFVFAQTYTGTMNITGNIGTTEGNDYPNFFPNASGATINALATKATSNGGIAEGDLDLAQTNGAQVNYVL